MYNSTQCRSRLKHCSHCLLFVIVIVIYARLTIPTNVEIDPWVEYGVVGATCLYLLKLVTFIALPQQLFNFGGLMCFNGFPNKIALNKPISSAPHVCFRIVTRGDFPQLVKDNVIRNFNICLDVELENFFMEVVTDRPIGIKQERRIREIVVPTGYRTKNGTLYKARALQYCLEDGVNTLNDNDWIVHLDEETILTENSIKGVLNFIMDGKHQLGQGVITYANEEIINWLTTLADSMQVSEDMGQLRFQFKVFNKALFPLKGSFFVVKVAAEKDVSFDLGLEGSITEDCFFAVRAAMKGYTFNFVEGEMWEKSPFTVSDYIKQRKRWLEGLLLLSRSKVVPLKNKLFMVNACYVWVTLPLFFVHVIINPFFPVPFFTVVEYLYAFMPAVGLYMYIFGVIKSFNVQRFGLALVIFFVCCFLLILNFSGLIYCLVVFYNIFSKKYTFYIVSKNYNHAVITA